MAKFEGFRIQNFRALKDITLGKLWNSQKAEALSGMTVVIGKNGVGKSTLFDAFSFLADCLKYGVEKACDHRGGFERIRSKGVTEPIKIEIYYRETQNTVPITYELVIDLDDYNRPFVRYERLRQRRKGQKTGWPFSFLILNSGQGMVWKGDLEGIEIKETKKQLSIDDLIAKLKETRREVSEKEDVEMDDLRRLGIVTLGVLKQHPRISAFRRFIEGWYLSYFTPNAARSLPLAGPQRHLNTRGDNLSNVVQFMEREYPEQFKEVLLQIADKIPGINQITSEKTLDGRLLLKFNDKTFVDPFYAQQMSDGTLKMLTYLLLLKDPKPPPFICIEEPENGLYHKLLETLANELRDHAIEKRSQVFVTTHQPYFVNALLPKEVWILEKGNNGFSTIRRVSDIDLVMQLFEQELPLGGLWFSDYFDEK